MEEKTVTIRYTLRQLDYLTLLAELALKHVEEEEKNLGAEFVMVVPDMPSGTITIGKGAILEILGFILEVKKRVGKEKP